MDHSARDNVADAQLSTERSTASAAGAIARAEWIGPLLLVSAAMLWSLNGGLIKLLNRGGEGPHGVVIAFYRSLIAGLFLIPFARGRFGTLMSPKRAATPSATTRTPPSRFDAVLCMIFFCLMTASFVTANTLTESANAIMLQYTSTFWIFGLSPWLLGERARPRDIVILALAMVGVAVIFAGGWRTTLPGLLTALSAGLFYGLLTLMIRRLRDVDSAALTVLNNLGAAALLLVPSLLLGKMSLTTREFFLILVLGIVQLGLPYYFYTLALARVPAYRAAILTMAEPVLVPVWAFLFVGEVPPRLTLMGGAIILGALVIQAVSGKSSVRKNGTDGDSGSKAS